MGPQSGNCWKDCEGRCAQGTRNGGLMSQFKLRLVLLAFASFAVPCVNGFGVSFARSVPKIGAVFFKKDVTFEKKWSPLGMSLNDDEQDIEEEEESFGDGDHVVLNDLSWRVEKLRLEEQNTKRFLKAGPRFLPYEECRKWVQAWSRWDNEDDWREWISMGEKRNPYVPARPDEYYGRLGQWISWAHFLGKEEKADEELGEFG